MNSQELLFIGNDPGSVKYGNFINYYSFHSPEERLKNFSSRMFPPLLQDKTIVCLDIGCNSGDLTIQLYKYLSSLYPEKSIFILGIDIDSTLIERAEEKKNENTTFLCLDIMSDETHKDLNIYLEQFDKKGFDITFSFSITMWIHLNNGDEGLKQFLLLLQTISRTIIIEPQPWKCYKRALKRIRKNGADFPLFKFIEIRNVENVIENTLTKIKFRKLYESSLSSWSRKIFSFYKQEL